MGSGRGGPRTDLGTLNRIPMREVPTVTAAPDAAATGQTRLCRAFFGAPALTIGLAQNRPFLGMVGNLSDILFGSVFVLGGGLWFVRIDSHRLRNLFHAIRTLEPVIWGGVLVTAGGAIASLDSAASPASWRVTLKYFAM